MTTSLRKGRLALFSSIHSLNTNFGTSILEPVALALASSSCASAASHQKTGTQISSEGPRVIQSIAEFTESRGCHRASPVGPHSSARRGFSH
ncbi:MAG: TdeIII family type II restriction endonuclease [Candidatus Zixiibacteriota bacterium]